MIAMWEIKGRGRDGTERLPSSARSPAATSCSPCAAARRGRSRVTTSSRPIPSTGSTSDGHPAHEAAFVTLRRGLAGSASPLSFQYYTAVFDWPLDVGGKPENSTLAFVPICFELTVLIGGLGTVSISLLSE